METKTLELTKRQEQGKAACNRYRRQGMLPAVVYAGNKLSQTVLVNDRDFVYLAERSLPSTVFSFKSEEKSLDGMKAVIKEVQKDVLKGKVLHIDFQALIDDLPAKVRVPLKVFGEPVGVKDQGGVLNVSAHELTVSASAENIPSVIEVDVSQLKIGTRIATADIDFPEGVSLASSPKQVVASVMAARTSKASEEEEAAAAAEAIEEAAATSDDKEGDASEEKAAKSD